MASSRSYIDWKRIKDLRSILAVTVATALGAGLVPKAPGTMGTLVAIPLAWATRNWDWPPRVALWIGLTALGTWAARVLDSLMGTGDNQCIVIDEVIGLGITSWTLSGTGNSVAGWIAAFLLFRLFDIVKLPPVRQVDQWSKKKALEKSPLAPWWGGFGVIADDIMAGFQGLLVLFLLQYFQFLAR